jgi:hypothetical protein
MTSLITLERANTAVTECFGTGTRLGVRAALFWLFSRLWVFHRFDGESLLPPNSSHQGANATDNVSHWAVSVEKNKRLL